MPPLSPSVKGPGATCLQDKPPTTQQGPAPRQASPNSQRNASLASRRKRKGSHVRTPRSPSLGKQEEQGSHTQLLHIKVLGLPQVSSRAGTSEVQQALQHNVCQTTSVGTCKESPNLQHSNWNRLKLLAVPMSNCVFWRCPPPASCSITSKSKHEQH